LDVVTATVPGTGRPEEEVFLIAHLCHPKPSANDNASGSGLLLEIARTINSLVKKGRIQRPQRTIRFLWVPETFGPTAYLHRHEDLPAKMVAGLNLDMVGQNQELCKSTLNLDRTPDSLPSFLNDFVFGIIEKSVKEFDTVSAFGSTSTFRYATTAFSGGSDHAEFTDSTIGVPCIMLLQWPDLYYHTSLDTIDKVSEDSLKRVGWIASVAVLTLANADAEEALLLASQTASRGMSRIEDAARQAVHELVQKKRDAKFEDKPDELAAELATTKQRHVAKIEHVIRREQQAIRSVLRLGESPELNAFVNAYCEDIEDLGKQEIARVRDVLTFVVDAANLKLPAESKDGQQDELKKMIPRRQFKGTLGFDLVRKGLGEEEFEWYRQVEEEDKEFGKKMVEILNFMDGKRSMLEILNAVSAEYSETKPENALKLVRDLEKLKLVALE
jgi:hypothetical protein